MAESTSERSPRAASASSRARYSRLAVRGLVVAGLAGVAWLLSSSAAHAANGAEAHPTSAADGSSRVHAGNGGLLGLGNLVGHVLPGSTRSEASGGPGLLESLVLQPVLRTVGKPVGTVVDRVHGTVGEVVNANATGSAATANPVVPVSRSRSAGATVPGGFTRTASAGFTRTAAPTELPTASGTAVQASAGHDGTATDGTVQRGAGSRHRATPGDRSAEASDRADLRRTFHVPLLPRPAPVPALPGNGPTTGAPSAGSGLTQDGGAPAIAPASPVAGMAITARLVAADDVAVRPLIAESPTVSPD